MIDRWEYKDFMPPFGFNLISLTLDHCLYFLPMIRTSNVLLQELEVRL